MKAIIVKTDGTRIEAEGTPEEIAKLAGAPAVQIVYVDSPCVRQHYPFAPVVPYAPPVWPGIIWGGVGSVRGCADISTGSMHALAAPRDPVGMAQS